MMIRKILSEIKTSWLKLMRRFMITMIIIVMFVVTPHRVLHIEAIAGSKGIVEDGSLLRAMEIGNIVVSCRDVMRAKVQVRKKYEADIWRAVQPENRATILKGLGNTSAIIVFIHGHNTPKESAIGNGNRLATYVYKNFSRELRYRKKENLIDPVTFITFSWKSDYGALFFEKSVQAAVSTGPCLAKFFSEVRKIANKTPIIVISHSLGSKVTLEALNILWSQSQQSTIDLLILVQAAIPWSDLYHGTEDIVLPPLIGQPRHMVFMDDIPFEGIYYNSIKGAKKVIATYSSTDKTLAKWYEFWSVFIQKERPRQTARIKEYPNIYLPLGLPPIKNDWQVGHSNYKEVPLILNGGKDENYDTHSKLFEDSEVFDRLWENWISQTIMPNNPIKPTQ